MNETFQNPDFVRAISEIVGSNTNKHSSKHLQTFGEICHHEFKKSLVDKNVF